MPEIIPPAGREFSERRREQLKKKLLTEDNRRALDWSVPKFLFPAHEYELRQIEGQVHDYSQTRHVRGMSYGPSTSGSYVLRPDRERVNLWSFVKDVTGTRLNREALMNHFETVLVKSGLVTEKELVERAEKQPIPAFFPDSVLFNKERGEVIIHGTHKGATDELKHLVMSFHPNSDNTGHRLATVIEQATRRKVFFAPAPQAISDKFGQTPAERSVRLKELRGIRERYEKASEELGLATKEKNEYWKRAEQLAKELGELKQKHSRLEHEHEEKQMSYKDVVKTANAWADKHTELSKKYEALLKAVREAHKIASKKRILGREPLKQIRQVLKPHVE